MKNRVDRRKYIVVGMIFLAIAAVLYLQKGPDETPDRSPDTGGTATTRAGSAPEGLEALLRAGLDHDVIVRGRVEDTAGSPVAVAEVMATTPQMGSGDSPLWLKTDEDGRFTVSGIKGASVYLKVNPPSGYAETSGSSRRVNLFVAREGKPSAAGKPGDSDSALKGEFKNPEQAVTLFLRKIDNADPVFYRKVTGGMPMGGEMRYVRIDSTSGSGLAVEPIPDGHSICLQCWTDKEKRVKTTTPGSNFAYRYPWSFKVSAPNGAVVRAEAEVPSQDEGDGRDFMAPTEGYGESVTISYSLEGDEKAWRPKERMTLFVKFADGTYGRMEILMDTWGSHFVALETVYNPSGRRNTEIDESKLLKE